VTAPLVSVVVPTHNRPGPLRRALESIAAQTLAGVEAVVVNDGGADVAAVVASVPGLDATYIAHERSRERSAARNTAIAAARGRWIAYLDDDDVFLPHHLETLVGAAEAAGARVAYSNARREIVRVVDGEPAVVASDVPYSVDFDRDRLAYENYIPILSMLHERACLDDVGGGFDESLSALEDWELFLRLSQRFDFVHVPVVTARFEERVDGTRGDFTAAAERLFAKHPTTRGDLLRLREGYLAGLRSLAGRPPAGSRPLATIVIPTFNNLELTRQCLDAIARTTEPGTAEIVVVDNASSDGTPAFLREAEAERRLRAVLNAENRGFSAACNQGAALARGSFVLFLNNDTVPQPGWLDALLATAADETVGIVGSKLLYADGTIQHAGVVVGEREGDPHPYHVYLCHPADAPHVSRTRDLQMVTGACLLIRRDVFEQLGGFDEAFWNGHEDLDLCLKTRAAGFRVVYCGASVVFHLESQTKRLIGLEQFHYEKGADTPEAQGRRLFLERWRDTIRVDDRAVLAEDGFGDGLHVLFTMVGWADEGGGTILPRQIAKALVRRGHRVTVLYAPVEERPDKPPYWVETSVDDGVRLIALYNRPARFNDPLNPEREIEDPRVEDFVAQLVDELRPDVAHVHSLLGFSMALPRALDAAGVPSVYTSHNYWPICPRMYLFRDDLSLCDGPEPSGNCAPCVGRAGAEAVYAERLEAGRRMLGEHVDRHLAVSHRVKELFVRAGHDASRIHVLHQQPESVDWLWREVGATRQPVDVLDRPLRVGFIGSLYAHKGVHVLVEALQALDPARVEGHLFGGGSDAYRAQLEQLDRNGVVRFHGGYDPAELPRLLDEVDVVCVPSVWEDCAPLVVAEALAARTPVVGSRIGGIPDFVDEQTGILVPHGTPAALAAAVGRFLDDPALLGRMQRAIAAPKGFDAYLDELLEHYAGAADDRRRRAGRIPGARRFAVLAAAADLVADPSLLTAYGARFTSADDATLVVHGPSTVLPELESAIAAAGLDGDTAPDMLALFDEPAEALAGRVDAVLGPHDDPTALRQLAELVWAA
jgi:GT2 family glycosyltransferase/glycosyltransferase involved in cell wall biosynthesis